MCLGVLNCVCFAGSSIIHHLTSTKEGLSESFPYIHMYIYYIYTYEVIIYIRLWSVQKNHPSPHMLNENW